MRPRTRFDTAFFVCCTLAAFGLASGARAVERPSIEPEAEQVLKAALGHLAQRQSFTVRAEVTDELVLPSGQKIQFSGGFEATVRRPDRLWSRFDDARRPSVIWYDGKSVTLLSGEGPTYATSPAPERIDLMLDALRKKLGFSPPLSLLLREDVVDRALQRVDAGFVVGRGLVNGVYCRHLAFLQENIDWQVWVAEEGEPLIWRIVITHKNERAAPQYAATFLSWDFNVRPGDRIFAFDPPAGAVRGDFRAPER